MRKRVRAPRPNPIDVFLSLAGGVAGIAKTQQESNDADQRMKWAAQDQAAQQAHAANVATQGQLTSQDVRLQGHPVEQHLAQLGVPVETLMPGLLASADKKTLEHLLNDPGGAASLDFQKTQIRQAHPGATQDQLTQMLLGQNQQAPEAVKQYGDVAGQVHQQESAQQAYEHQLFKEGLTHGYQQAEKDAVRNRALADRGHAADLVDSNAPGAPSAAQMDAYRHGVAQPPHAINLPDVNAQNRKQDIQNSLAAINGPAMQDSIAVQAMQQLGMKPIEGMSPSQAVAMAGIASPDKGKELIFRQKKIADSLVNQANAQAWQKFPGPNADAIPQEQLDVLDSNAQDLEDTINELKQQIQDLKNQNP